MYQKIRQHPTPAALYGKLLVEQKVCTQKEIEEMQQLSGSYEALFSKKAILYKSMDLKNKVLTEDDYKNLILEHYTFLSRPVFIIDNKIYIGNSQQNILQVMKQFNGQ